MKKLLILLLLQVALLSGCRKKAVGFEMNYLRRFEIPAGLSVVASHNFVLKDISADTFRFFQANGTSASKVSIVEPFSMSLRAFFQNGSNTFANVERVEVFIADMDKPLSERIIFFRDEIPFTIGERLDLVPNNENVRRFLMEGSTRFNVRINLRFRSNTERSIETEVDFAFFARL